MLSRLGTLRDEFKLQAHLFKEDFGKRLDEWARQWGGIRSTAKAAKREVGEASQQWASVVRENYHRVKKTISQPQRNDH